ncbi:MAG: hypothetical protein WBM02_00165 [bacterium]
MGMPISSYTVLSALALGQDSYETEIAQRVLRPFNLFAFIIHDPNEHREFHNLLSRQFDRLDYLTGQRLLFFALVDPPKEWLAHGQNRDYYELLSSQFGNDHYASFTSDLLNPANAPVSKDLSNTAFSLANALGIPFDDLPCIVVTEGFHRKDFRKFRTSPYHLEKQLSELGYLAARGTKHLPKTSNEWRNVNLCFDSRSESLNDSLAKALSDVLSFIVAEAVSENRRESWLYSRAFNQARDTINQLYTNIDRLKAKSEEFESEELDHLCICLVSFLALMNNLSNITPYDFITFNREWFEGDSFQILRTANKVYDLLMGNQLHSLIPMTEEESLDFAPGVICLAKVFEKEVNLSVVHWARKILGVSLPEYFNKPQPGLSATVIPSIKDAREIDLNMGRRGKWLPPGIGQSELACQELSKTTLPTGWDKTNWDLLLRWWKIVRQERNQAAHTELINKTSMLNVRDIFQKMFDSGLFERFYRMKREYRDQT